MGRVTAVGGQWWVSPDVPRRSTRRPSLDRLPFEVSKRLGGINRYWRNESFG